MKKIILATLLTLVSISASTANVVSRNDAKAWCEALYADAGMDVSAKIIRECTKIVMKNGYIVVIIDIE